MKHLTALAMPCLLLVLLVSLQTVLYDRAYGYHYLGEAPKMMIPTDNGSMFVEISIEKARVIDNALMLDAPQEVTIDAVFLNPGAFEPIMYINYDYQITDEVGNIVVRKTNLQAQDGIDTRTVTFADTGSFTITVEVKGRGLSEPYDTSRSGTANVMITVVPEFPLSVMAIMAAVIGIGIGVTKFKSHPKF